MPLHGRHSFLLPLFALESIFAFSLPDPQPSRQEKKTFFSLSLHSSNSSREKDFFPEGKDE
jgi:hypothetical protein